NTEISKENGQLALQTVNKLFNLDFNLNPFYDEVKDEKILSKLTQELKGLKSPATASVYESLVDAIVEQQISLRVAHSIQLKIIKKYGSTLNVDGHTYYAYPTPKQLNNAPFNELRECGLTLRKTEYIKSISNDIEQGKLDLEKFRDYKDANKIINELCKIRGIGLWTAEFVMIRGLNRLESLPADDIGIRRVISQYYCGGRRISSDDTRKIAESWGKWKGLAAFYLIIAEMSNINF
ncbi:MAG: DNA-3-methyladenine glycosylase family protein, partial [Methanobacterium sp.]